jgi:hypothetical protein
MLIRLLAKIEKKRHGTKRRDAEDAESRRVWMGKISPHFSAGFASLRLAGFPNMHTHGAGQTVKGVPHPLPFELVPVNPSIDHSLAKRYQVPRLWMF